MPGTVERVQPRYTGFAPIGTCHWQGVSNILHTYGLEDAQRRVVLSWGATWRGGEILHGGGRWAALLEAVFGARVEKRSFRSAESAGEHEQMLAASRLPFVAEVDAFHLPSRSESAHVVHTVVVLARSPAEAVILDTMNNPVPVSVPVALYQNMRSSECEGRVEPHLLYAPLTGPYRHRRASAVLAAVQTDLALHGEEDLAALGAFIDWYQHRGSQEVPVNVCRVAAERHQAALTFDRLAEEGEAVADRVSGDLRALARLWYVVHMLTVHAEAGEERHRSRILRFLRRLAAQERSVLLSLTSHGAND
jgi:hypothetical protein